MRRRPRLHSVLGDEKLDKLRGKKEVTQELGVEELRRIRIERLEGNAPRGGPASSSKMATESHASVKEPSSHRRKHHRSAEGKKHRRKRISTTKGESGTTYVYGPPAEKPRSTRILVSETRKLGRDEDSSSSEGG